MGKASTYQQFDGFHFGKPILGLHYDPENAFFAPFQYLKYNLWKGMEIQKILAWEEGGGRGGGVMKRAGRGVMEGEGSDGEGGKGMI